MNWYGFLKFAQIVSSFDPDNFQEVMTAFYEAEYKYSMLQQREFKGHPKRYENILKALENQIYMSGNRMREMLQEVYEDWLADHALLEPEQWAEMRNKYMEDIGLGGQFKHLLSGFVSQMDNYEANNNYGGYGQFKDSNYEGQFVSKIMEALNEDNLPHNMQQLKNGLLEGHKETMLQEFFDDVEHFNEIYDTNFDVDDQDEAEDFMDKYVKENLILEDTFFAEDLTTLVDTIESIQMYTNAMINDNELINEISSRVNFPVWFSFWEPRGIVETRDRVEKTYQALQSADPSNLGDFTAKINLAINQTHQTGPMVEYIEDRWESWNIAGKMHALTQGNFVEKWNSDLRAIGVQI